ncbi:ORM1-like protein 3, partial [Dinothrombium tinctorium]
LSIFNDQLLLLCFHRLLGTPWETGDQGSVSDLTHWEQIDDGAQFTATRKFLTVFPIILFFLTSFYTKYDSFHFVINFTALLLVLLPKLPQFHKVRIFGINQY